MNGMKEVCEEGRRAVSGRKALSYLALGVAMYLLMLSGGVEQLGEHALGLALACSGAVSLEAAVWLRKGLA